MSDFDTFDLYQVLGVERDASEAEIRDAFNRAALTEHPDRSGHPEAEQRIRRVYQARDTLLNARLRAAYDPDADQRERRAAQERAQDRQRQAPPPRTPEQPKPPPKPQRMPRPRPLPRRRERTEREEDRADRPAAQEQLRELAGSTILAQRRWFRADSDRQHYYVAAYAEFQRREERYLMALMLAPGLFFSLLAIGSFATGDTVGGIISLVVALVAFVACRYLAALAWFVWVYLIVAVAVVELAKIVYAGLRVSFRFIRSQLQQRWQTRTRSSNSED